LSGRHGQRVPSIQVGIGQTVNPSRWPLYTTIGDEAR
jgi:hypothetical protein